MEGIQEFEAKLGQAVRAKRQELDAGLLPQLQRDLQAMLSACNAISAALVRKSILHSSSVQYDASIEEIIPPSTDFIPRGKGSIYVLGNRFGQYMAMLAHALLHYQFSCAFLTLPRISKLDELLRSFNWESLSTSSENNNTRGFAEIIQEFKRTGDTIAVGAVSGSISQLAAALPACLNALRVLSAFQREAYKLEVRTNVLPRADIHKGNVSEKAALDAIKKAFPQAMGGAHFYSDLIGEIIAENSSDNAPAMRERVLSALVPTERQQKKEDAAETEEDYRDFLVSGLRMLGGASQQLTLIVSKIAENLKIYQASQVTFFTKLKELFRRAFNVPAKEVEIEIVVADPASQAQKREIISFNKYIDALKNKAQVLGGFDARDSAFRHKLDAVPDERLLEILSSNISEMNEISRQCDGIDEFFKSAVKGESKQKMRGIKVEISTIRNAIVKANQMRAAYSARAEEKEQLKRLGIT